MKSFFILIQGPYTKNTEELIYQIKKILPNNEISLSCYDESINKDFLSKISLKRSVDPGTIYVPPRGKPLNLHRQAKTVLKGCLGSSKEWVMKLRSDLEIKNLDKFKSFVNNIDIELKNDQDLKLVTLNTGSLDIFSFYDMPLHFNDWFFICKRDTLIKNCERILTIPEITLVSYFNKGLPKNYYHKNKYQLRYHVEQLIHFADKFYRNNMIDYCCDLKINNKFRHIIWVGKHLRLFSLKSIGICSSKVGYPTLESHLVGISYGSLKIHKIILNTKTWKRTITFLVIYIHGGFRKYLFLLIRSFKKFLFFMKIFFRKLFKLI